VVQASLDDGVRISKMEAVERKWGYQSLATRFFGKVHTECNISPNSP
jgi:hypothetical protein